MKVHHYVQLLYIHTNVALFFLCTYVYMYVSDHRNNFRMVKCKYINGANDVISQGRKYSIVFFKVYACKLRKIFVPVIDYLTGSTDND